MNIKQIASDVDIKWNKEILQINLVEREYHRIEKNSKKASGNWLKNKDGSEVHNSFSSSKVRIFSKVFQICIPQR
jgi:hypothetical protein